jgi:hypothetical protein
MGLSLAMLCLPCHSENATPCRLPGGIGSGIVLGLSQYNPLYWEFWKVHVGRHGVLMCRCCLLFVRLPSLNIRECLGYLVLLGQLKDLG